MSVRKLTLPVPATVPIRKLAALLILGFHPITVLPVMGYGRMAKDRGVFRELSEYYEQVEQAIPKMQCPISAGRSHGLCVYFTRLTAGGPVGMSPNARVKAC